MFPFLQTVNFTAWVRFFRFQHGEFLNSYKHSLKHMTYYTYEGCSEIIEKYLILLPSEKKINHLNFTRKKTKIPFINVKI